MPFLLAEGTEPVLSENSLPLEGIDVRRLQVQVWSTL